MSSSASSVSSQKKDFISTGDCTKLEILLLRTLVTKHTLSNVYAQSKTGKISFPAVEISLRGVEISDLFSTRYAM